AQSPDEEARPATASSAKRPPPFVLGIRTPKVLSTHSRGIGLRELVRQALLIAARDELGLTTRDAALREPFPTVSAGELPRLDVEVYATAPTDQSRHPPFAP